MNELLIKIANKFVKEGFELFEVGGHVRDSILHRESHDIDLATNARPEKIKGLIREFGTIYDVGEKFGTIGLVVGEQIIEITTYRKEVYALESRKPNVVFGNSLFEDLARRDFTINAIARSPITEGIIDPYGGVRDITRRVIRCVGNEDARFDEDPLRMLRAIRFACQLDFKLEVRINHPERLKIISLERIHDEFSKIILSDRPGFGVRKLCSTGLMEHMIPEFVNLKHIQQGKNHIKDAFHHSLLVLDKGAKVEHKNDNLVFRLACLLHDIAKPETKTEDETGVHFYSHHYVGAKKARKILKRLRYDNETTDKVCHLIQYHMMPIMLQREMVEGELKHRVVMRMIRKIGEDNIYMLLDLVKCDIRSSANPRYKFMLVLEKLVNECMKEKPETLVSPLDGDEIMALFSIKPSQAVGKIKNYLTTLVIDGIIDKDDKDGARQKALEYIGTLDVKEIMNGRP